MLEWFWVDFGDDFLVFFFLFLFCSSCLPHGVELLTARSEMWFRPEQNMVLAGSAMWVWPEAMSLSTLFTLLTK